MARTILNISAVVVIAAFAIIGLVTSHPEPPKSPARPAARVRPTATPQSDQTGPRRIITMAPGCTEIVFALGAGDRVVGVSSLCTYPPEALTRPRVAGRLEADLDRILKLRPDLIIMAGHRESIRQLCRQNDIALLAVGGSGLESVYRAITIIGTQIGRSHRADRLVGQIRSQIRRIAEATDQLERRRVFVSVGRDVAQPLGQIYTFGKAQLFSQLIERAGGKNIFADVDTTDLQVGLDEIAERRPEVIIELMPGQADASGVTRQALDQWRTLDSLPAVRNERVYVLTEDYTVVAGPRVGQLARLLAETIHPHAFGQQPGRLPRE